MVEKKKNSKYQYAIVLGMVTFVALIISIFAVVNPLFKKSQNITTEVKQRQTELKKLEDKKTKLIALKEKEETLKADLEKVSAALPEKNQVGRLFIQIDEMAKQINGGVTGISLGGVGEGTTATTEGISKISYSIPLQAPGYESFKEFLLKTENALRIMDVSGVAVSSGSDSSMQINLSANTYVRN